MAVTAASLIATISVQGADQAKSDIEGVGSVVSNAGDFLKNALVTGAIAAGAAIVGFGVKSVQAAAGFQDAITSLKTGAGESQSNLKLVSDGILDLATKTGTSTQQLTSGMYMIESAGFHGAAGLQVLQAAAEGAKVGNADLGTVANAVTTVMHDYASSNFTATQATNALVATVASGKTHMQDLANSLSTVLPLSSSLHIPFEQVAGAMATMTNAGMPAQHAAQNLAFMIRSMNTESSKGSDALTNIGLSAAKLHDILTNQGLPTALQTVEDHIGKKWPLSSQDGQQALKEIMGGAAGLNAALMIGGEHMKEFSGDVSAVGNTLQSKSKDVQGWADVQNTFNFRLQQAQEAVEVLEIKVGTALLPILSQLLSQVTPLIAQFADWVTKNDIVGKSIDAVKITINDAKNVIQGTIGVIQNIINWWNAWHTPIELTATAITVFFLPALIKIGIQAAITAAQLSASFIASMYQTAVTAASSAASITGSFLVALYQTGAEGWASAGKLAALIFSFIATKAQAIATAVVMEGQLIAAFIATKAQAIATAVVMEGQLIAAFIATKVQAAITGAGMVADFVAGLISMAAESIVSAGVMLSTLVPALISVAASVVAATWPFLLIAAVVAAVVAGIVLAVQHWGEISQWLQGVWSNFSSWFQNTLQTIGNFFHSVWEGIVSFFQSVGNILVSIGKAAALLLLAVIIGPIGLLAIFVAQHWQQILSITQSIWSSITSSVSSAVSGIVSFITNSLGGLASAALSWGRDMINNFISGLTNAAGGLVSEAQNIAGQVASILHFSKPDVGPLANADTWMPDFMDLLASGINTNLDKIKSASLNVATTISTGTASSTGETPSSFSSPTQGGLQGLSVIPSSVSQANNNIQIVVQPAPVMLDGRMLASGVLPHLVNQIRTATGTTTY